MAWVNIWKEWNRHYATYILFVRPHFCKMFFFRSSGWINTSWVNPDVMEALNTFLCLNSYKQSFLSWPCSVAGVDFWMSISSHCRKITFNETELFSDSNPWTLVEWHFQRWVWPKNSDPISILNTFSRLLLFPAPHVNAEWLFLKFESTPLQRVLDFH